jgi:hypothetical protein
MQADGRGGFCANFNEGDMRLKCFYFVLIPSISCTEESYDEKREIEGIE